MNIANPGDLVTVASAPTDFEAQTKAAVLESEGIEAFVFTAAHFWTGGVGFGLEHKCVRVWVRRRDVDRAREILSQRIADSIDVDWDEVDVGERADELPLTPTDRMPRLAKVVWVALEIGALVTVVAALIALFL